MKRRLFIIAYCTGGVTVSGCVSNDGTEGTPTTSAQKDPKTKRPTGQMTRDTHTSETTGKEDDQTKSKKSPGPGFPTISVQGEAINEKHSIKASVMVSSQFTALSPAELQVSITNYATEARTFQFGAVPPFTPRSVNHDSAEASLILVPSNGYDVVPDSPVNGCWNAIDEPVFKDVVRIRELNPNETQRETYVVLASPKNDKCMPAGTYRATSGPILFQKRSKNNDNQSEWTSIDYGFSIVIG